MAGEIIEEPIEPVEARALKLFDVIDRKSGKVVYSYEYDAPLDLKGFEAKDFDHIERVKPLPEPVIQTIAATLTPEDRDRFVAALQQLIDALQKAS